MLDTKVATNRFGCIQDINNKTINAVITYIFLNFVYCGSNICSNSYSDGFYLFSIKNYIYLTIVSGYTNLIKILLDIDLYVTIYYKNYLNS